MAFMTERLKRLLIIGAVAILLAGTVSLWFSLSPTQRAWRYYLAGAKISCCGEPDPIAIKHFKKALQLNPRLFEARRGLAAIYANIGRKRDAAALYQEAMRIEPSDPRPRYELAELALPEQPEKAIRHLKDYLSLRPNDLQAWYLLAQCYREAVEGSAMGLGERCSPLSRRSPCQALIAASAPKDESSQNHQQAVWREKTP